MKILLSFDWLTGKKKTRYGAYLVYKHEIDGTLAALPGHCEIISLVPYMLKTHGHSQEVTAYMAIVKEPQ